MSKIVHKICELTSAEGWAKYILSVIDTPSSRESKICYKLFTRSIQISFLMNPNLGLLTKSFKIIVLRLMIL